ncbi:MAG: Ribosome biogenesis protein erb1 [Thelocarpon superellum]|nr:MAG: Ribosome biogenesis protein erb1 [Thelocarpon superellum]
MVVTSNSKKRKPNLRELPDPADVASDDEFETGLLDGAISDGGESRDSDQELEESDDEEIDDEEGEGNSGLEDGGDGIDGNEFPLSSLDNDARPLRSHTAGQTRRAKSASNAEDRVTEAAEAAGDEDPDAELASNYTVTTDANGNPRYVYREINPVYDSDDSDAPATTNTIGDIPLSFYDTYPHIGYDINGKKIMRPATGEALDALLESIDVPKGWTGLTDPATGLPLELTQEELEVLKMIQKSEIPEEGYDPYPATVEYFTSKTETMPLSAAPEPKRRFVPSKHEAKRIMKIVRAIREGRILPYKPPSTEEEDPDVIDYDLWADEKPRPDHVMNIPAPKLPPPGYEQSYHPPPEYLPTPSEKKAWEAADEEDREADYLPTSYDALRKVPGYDQFVKERFERSLDLYLAPRIRRNKLNIDPDSLLPKLPSPEDLRPFPTTCATIFRGHRGRVRSLDVDPAGIWLASGGDDGTVRVWEVLTGRQVWNATLAKDDVVNVVRWRPGLDAFVLAAATGESTYLMVPPLVNPEVEASSREIIDAGWGYAADGKAAPSTAAGERKDPPATWTRPSASLADNDVLIKITVRAPIKVIAWHRRGEYFATVSPTGHNSAIAMHTLSKHLTQLPFRRLRGLAQTVQFHPSKPILFVATQRSIRSYDLVRQELLKTLQPGARWISSIDVHPGGDNLIVGSYDRRLLWHDMDLQAVPYKTLRYHSKAIRAVRFHPGGLPLFADASDDGSLQIFHGKVVGDLMQNATIVPLKVLRGHRVENMLGVLDLVWHPTQPWCFSAGADGTCRLWM